MQNKRHVKNFKTFVNENLNTDAENSLNEGLFKWLKDKISMAISKKIGGASKIDAQTKAYLPKMKEIIDRKLQLEKDLTDSKKKFEDNPKDPNLKKAYELKQKSHEGQMKAVLDQETALKNQYNLNLKTIVGTDNPQLSQYAEMVKAENDVVINQHIMDQYQTLEIHAEEYEKLAAKIKTEKEAIKQKQDALKAALQMEKEAEEDSEDAAPNKIRLNDKFKYVNSKGKELIVQVVDLLKNDKVMSQNGTMVQVVNVKKLKDKTARFRVKKTALKPIQRVTRDEENNVVTTNRTEGQEQAQTATV